MPLKNAFKACYFCSTDILSGNVNSKAINQKLTSCHFESLSL